VGWVCIGPGACNWGTSMGLAELATCSGPTPEWHAQGVAISPAPNIVFLVCGAALETGHMAQIVELCELAEQEGLT